jgi:hypothetical protein
MIQSTCSERGQCFLACRFNSESGAPPCSAGTPSPPSVEQPAGDRAQMQVQTQMLTPIHTGCESAHTNVQAPIQTQGRSCGAGARGSGLSACRAWAALVKWGLVTVLLRKLTLLVRVDHLLSPCAAKCMSECTGNGAARHPPVQPGRWLQTTQPIAV